MGPQGRTWTRAEMGQDKAMNVRPPYSRVDCLTLATRGGGADPQSRARSCRTGYAPAGRRTAASAVAAARDRGAAPTVLGSHGSQSKGGQSKGGQRKRTVGQPNGTSGMTGSMPRSTAQTLTEATSLRSANAAGAASSDEASFATGEMPGGGSHFHITACG